MVSQGIASLLWFVAILALIPLALWLLKRTPIGGAAAQGQLRSIAMLPLSTNQRIVTVEVGQGDTRRWLVLGVTPQSITTLHTMEPQAEAPTGASSIVAAQGFAQVFARLKRGRAGSDAA